MVSGTEFGDSWDQRSISYQLFQLDNSSCRGKFPNVDINSKPVTLHKAPHSNQGILSFKRHLSATWSTSVSLTSWEVNQYLQRKAPLSINFSCPRTSQCNQRVCALCIKVILLSIVFLRFIHTLYRRAACYFLWLISILLQDFTSVYLISFHGCLCFF